MDPVHFVHGIPASRQTEVQLRYFASLRLQNISFTNLHAVTCIL